MSETTLSHHDSEAAFTPAIDLARTEAETVFQAEKPALSADELDELIFSDERVIANISRLKEARGKGHGAEAEVIISEQKELVEKVKVEILMARGEYENPEEKLERLEGERHAAVEEIAKTLSGNETEDELLRAYKMTDSEGQLTKSSIQSPLFHTYTKSAFSHYLSMVDKFDAMSQAEAEFKMGLKGIGKANLERTEAHNAVAKLVGEDLDIEFDKARRLVAKMRDEILPGSGETQSYASAIRRGGNLHSKFGGDVAWAIENDMHFIDKALKESLEH